MKKNILKKAYTLAEVIEKLKKNCEHCIIKKDRDRAWASNGELILEIKLLKLRYGKNVRWAK